MKSLSYASALFAALALPACGGGGKSDNHDGGAGPDGSGACAVTDWSAPDFDQNAADALVLREQLGALVGAMSMDETDEDVDAEALDSLYAAGSPSLADTITGDYDAIVEKSLADFVTLIEEGVATAATDEGVWTGGPNGDGAIFFFEADDTRRALNGAGLEPRQLVDKGLYGAVSYRYALGLTEGEITVATVDALAAAWGTDAELTPDLEDSAHYSYSMGFHAPIAELLTEARAHAADPECAAERDDAIRSFFRTWELALMARAVYYANAGATALAEADTADTDAGRVDAFHELAEGIGLALGFYGMPDPESGPLSGAGRVVTDADIESMMGALGVDLETAGTFNDSTTASDFVGDEAAFQTAVESIEGTVTEAYDLTEADLESYRDPTEG